ncbi:DNA methyltransferase [Sphaerospermopsis sp. FACHB-1194]|uniref:Methyltransferase n=2 Tax=Sphaerospermopsis reniformis TaxID=531300 RepID=A0A480A6R0_9CYAN|nr:DNA methyltransferase [Sphaerospermopsis sp. FACHB-1194]GCL39586.1 putative DNA methyltransferase [Sphaerospermopsis reniformis]
MDGKNKFQYDGLSECGGISMSIPTTVIDGVHIEMADALSRYVSWLSPTVIVSDGAYGLGLFPGDPINTNDLQAWYAPHIEAWSKYALPETTLWFWCSEIGWATVHPLLEKHGWLYRSFHVWDKGIGHIAGNVNSKTIRRFPVVTEACVQYVRHVKLSTIDGKYLTLQEWLRYEWERSGLPLNKTNEACGVKNAATRKYFTKCHLWYFPPPDKMEQIVAYANKYGKPTNRPYFSIDGKTPVTAQQWSKMRSTWNHIHAVTNVWSEPQVSGDERIKLDGKTLHSNQKPLSLIENIITASSNENDVVWEPFGGLCPSAIISLKNKRRCYSAEINNEYYHAAKSRLQSFVTSNYLFNTVEHSINLETSLIQSRIINNEVLQPQQLSLFL